MPITTIIFDYGCVLSLAPRLEDFEPLRKAMGVEAATFQEIYWRHREAYDLDTIDAPTYWQESGTLRASPSLLTKFSGFRLWTFKCGRNRIPSWSNGCACFAAAD